MHAIYFTSNYKLEVCTAGILQGTAVIETTFMVIPWGQGHVSRGYCGDRKQRRR